MSRLFLFGSLLALLLNMTSFQQLQAETVKLQVENGQFTFTHWNRANAYRLYGDWLFYPNEVVSPREFLEKKDLLLSRGQLLSVGQGFTDPQDPKLRATSGYGTYILRLDGLPGAMMGVSGWTAFTASRLYMFADNGQGADSPLVTVGEFSQKQEELKPSHIPEPVTPFTPYAAKTHYILIQVANVHHSWGGLWIPPTVGDFRTIMNGYTANQRINFWLVGISSFVAVYSFALFMRRREDKASFWLFILASERSLRNLWWMYQGTDILGDLTLSYELHYKLQWLFWMPSMVLFYTFFRACFPKQTPRWMIPATLVCTLLPFFYAALTPVRIHYPVIKPLFTLLNPLFGFLCFSIVIRAYRAREDGAGWSLLGGVCLLLGGIIDILYTLDIVRADFTNFVGLGVVAFLVFQTQIVGYRFAQAFRKAEHLSRELKKEVDRQTRDIKLILNNIQQGIFTVSHIDKAIDPLYSRYLYEMIGDRNIAQRRLQDLLLDRSELDSDAKAQVRASLEASIGEDKLSYDFNAPHLVRELNYLTFDNRQRKLELDWVPVLNDRDVVEKVLVCLRDVTELQDLKIVAQQQEEDLKMLVELISIPEDRFHRFILKTLQYLQENRDILNISDTHRPEVIKRLFINMHTIKGSARAYFLRAISNASHEVEQFYSALQKNPSDWDKDKMIHDIDLIEELLNRYKEVGKSKLGWQLSERSVKIPAHTLEKILASLSDLGREYLNPRQRTQLNTASSLLYSAGFVRIHDIFEESCRGLDSMARDIGKLEPEIVIDAPLVILRENGVNLLHAVLIHMLRNAIDHGLEKPEERKRKGKPERGIIYVKASLDHQYLLIDFYDDGNGLNLEAIRSKALERGLIKAEDSFKPEQVAQLIFESGLSTKDTISEISGRGVGLDAVRKYLEENGGSISLHLAGVENQRQVSFHFDLKIPLKFVITMPDEFLQRVS